MVCSAPAPTTPLTRHILHALVKKHTHAQPLLARGVGWVAHEVGPLLFCVPRGRRGGCRGRDVGSAGKRLRNLPTERVGGGAPLAVAPPRRAVSVAQAASVQLGGGGVVSRRPSRSAPSPPLSMAQSAVSVTPTPRSPGQRWLSPPHCPQSGLVMLPGSTTTPIRGLAWCSSQPDRSRLLPCGPGGE